ncbi:MAG: outer membrane protein assembly factor BamD [Sandaracinaceae bacterium]|nr:outer membrane protein assembly factor BamD [Sandaracinaceae bacterium]
MRPAARRAGRRRGGSAAGAASRGAGRPSPPAAAAAPARRPRASAPRDAPPASATETASRCDDQPDPEGCLRALADGDGLVAEAALYRLGRRRARAGDHPAALDAWLEHSRRFPRGVLAQEIHLAILDAQLATGSPQALATADRFLTDHPASTQRGEVHAVGATLRHRAGDCASALTHYDAAIATRLAARRREEALYGRASCLDTLGRREEATAAYRLYLEAHPEGRFAARARARVERDVVLP